MSATALAECRHLSAIDHLLRGGRLHPQPETLTAISGALTVPESYFLHDFAPVEAPAIHFRALKKTPKKARLSARIKPLGSPG